MVESSKETDPAKQRAMREEAVLHFKMAVKIYPKFLNASFDLGRAYLVLQQNDSAYSTWEQTRTIDTSFALPCYMMAVIQQNKGNLKKAAELYEHFLSKYPTDLQAVGNLSYVYYGLADYQKSLDTKKRALDFNPGNFELLSSVAQTYLQMSMKDSALVYFEKALMFNPTDGFVIQKIQELKNDK
jgi:tetratricopeptide (TPR) repeat protein